MPKHEGLKDNIFEALVTNIQPDNPGENFDFSDKAMDKVEKLAEDLSGAIVKWVEAQTFTIEEAECTIQIPPITSQVSTAVNGGVVAGPGAPVVAAVGTGTAVSPMITGNAVIKATKLGTPSNQSPQANAKSQSSKVRLINTIEV